MFYLGSQRITIGVTFKNFFIKILTSYDSLNKLLSVIKPKV